MSDVPPGPSVLSPAPTDISPLSATLNHSGVYGKVPGPQPGGGGEQEQEEEEAAALDGADQERSGEGGPRSANSVGNYPEPNRAKKGVLHLHHHHHHHHHQQQQQRLLNGCVISPELHYKAECKGRLSCAEAATAVEFHPGLSLPEGGRRKADGNYCESPNVNHANQRTAEAAGPNALNPSDGLDRIAISPDDDEQYRLAASIADCSLHPEQQPDSIRYVGYESELQMPDIMRLITKDLSEPYSIYTYRYFIHNWPQLCFLAMVGDECVGAIVCKLDMHKKMFRRGYIAMLAVDSKYRRKSIGTNLVKKAIYAMVEGDCDEVVLETEITNKSALKLYENLGFVRDKRLFRYYLNGVDALRLKLWLR
ncbi:N-alpha-acetyltransferase 30 isoform X2 [Chiloscyllium plagiosum]|nr:N-alpha-acetyltransferase 30 isoform X2 [Chiloscyllium plagiosum]XP_043553675.1 N-alpha-acetyltransferase 30 isoform X2 [Chiloscyllium plagiosum]